MNVLALEPYYGGSHRRFLEDWRACSRHNWTILSAPPRKWKWRMRHAAVTFADEVRLRVDRGERWDVVFCSDMLNLSEFRGLAPKAARDLPTALYFHENQFVYPFRYMGERDLHFGFTNMTSALAADSVWFNSAFNRDSFLEEMQRGLRKMPDYRLPDAAERIRAKSRVEPLGVREIAPAGARPPGPLRIVWAARWEHDKDPETFFAAVQTLVDRGLEFRLNVIGEQFAESPEVFDDACVRFAAHIDRWGYQPTRADYEDALREAHVAVSTAQHEFFGVSVVEAVAAGAYPVLPDRLSYPELFSVAQTPSAAEFFYAGDALSLAEKLADLIRRHAAGEDLWGGDPWRARRAVERFFWTQRGPQLDAALESVAAL